MDDIIKQLVNLAEQVQNILGPGYSERIYHNAMEVMLRENNISYDTERVIPVYFKNHVIGNSRADLIVNNKIVVELKAIANINNSVRHQAKTYINNTGFDKTIIINFQQSDKSTELQYEIIQNS